MSDTFLTRWSKLKRGEDSTGLEAEPSASPTVVPDDLKDLDIARIGADFDFTRMMRVDVPPALRTAVLRRLWSKSPALFAPDCLDTYCEDYNAPERTVRPAEPCDGETT